MIMKRFAILAAVVALIGCTQNDKELDNITNIPSKSQTEFYASMPECDTRTYVEDNKYLRWNAGDEITVFAGNSYNGHWQFAGEDGTNSGKFNEVDESGFVTGTPLDLTANYAIYPYDENITITEAGVVSLTLPAVQEYNHTYANSFGEGANTMMAVTKNTFDNFLSFKNLCGYLKLKFYGENVTVKSVTVKGNNGEKIAGKATVSMAYGGEPTITMGDDATDTITIDCGEGVALSNDAANPTTFWVVIPEITFEGGITIEVTDINDQTFSKQTTNAVPIENNLIQPMATLGVETAPAGPANNEIWYTNGSSTQATTPYKTNVFGANIVSNTYDKEKKCWVIKFDGKVTKIGDNAFNQCESLTSVTIPDSVTSIGDGAFILCTKLKSINIPDSVTTIGDSAFNRCDNLTSITIPNSVTTIKNTAFAGCYSLTSITIPNSVTTLNPQVFSSCTSLTSVTIPNSVITILNAFSDCDSLTTITIPDSVTTIGESAFRSCDNLTSVAIGNSVMTIGKEAFSYCKSLISITIPDSVTTIGESAFSNCSSLTSITIPDSVTAIGKYTFSSCNSLTSITIPDGLTTIGGDYAFYYCDNLKSVYCKATTPPSLGNYAFSSWAYNLKIYVPNESVEAYKVASGWSQYASKIIGYNFKPETDEIWYTNGSTTEATTPHQTNVFGANIVSNTYNTEKECWIIKFDGEVTTIGYIAFLNCSSLTSITIPNNVTSIGSLAFRNCSNLTRVTIPDSVTAVDSGAFTNCSSLQKFRGKFASEDGRCLIVNGVLNSFAPAGLTEYTITDSVTTIGSSAFYYCQNLTSVTIPNSVTSIEYMAFSDCSNLTNVTISDRVIWIKESAFYGCKSLTSVTIPKSVMDIEQGAFSHCSSLTNVYCKPTLPPGEGWDIFDYNISGRKIYVPTGSVTAYKSAEGWSGYASDIVGYDFASCSVNHNSQWRLSSSVSNPDSSLYDGVYESNSNYNVNNGVATMYIDIEGYTEFSIYIRSNAESNYDYVMVSQLDKTITGSTSCSDTTLVKAHTRGNQKSGSSISDYTKVTYSNISSGTHRITIVYRKDSSQHSGADRGYVLIPKNQ